MTYVRPGMTVTTLDGDVRTVEWVRSRNEVEGITSPVLIGDYVKLEGDDTLWFPWDLSWEGQYDELTEFNQAATDEDKP